MKKNKEKRRNSKKNNFFLKKIFFIVRSLFSLTVFFIKKLIFLFFSLPEQIKRVVFGSLLFFLGIFFLVSNLKKGGIVGEIFVSSFSFLFGQITTSVSPLFLFLVSLVLFFSQYKKIFFPLLISFSLIVFGLSAFFESLEKGGGFFGRFLTYYFEKLFGPLISQILFFLLTLVGFILILSLLKREGMKTIEEKPSIFKRIFAPSFKVEKVEEEIEVKKQAFQEKEKKETFIPKIEMPKIEYKKPPLELLEKDQGAPLPGDIKQNSIIIKKTLESFGIPVEMGEVNVGPTVTQYTLKPADGIKLSRITSLSNDLALALASHPIRIEAPIPGKSLVGIEVPNNVRSMVRLRELISLPQFQNAPSPLCFVLGRDVSGNPAFADLARMPHLLVAGATGTGKTIFLNTLILSLIFRNSPEILNFILIDPKRVEFSIYSDIPHVITEVVVDVQKAVNVLKWLIEEMERRFDVLRESKTRDILGYNSLAAKDSKIDFMPYIVLIIDELADLMAARGREIEAGIVRLAQMARAVGIHLVLATQRPSTEVITGLIKANITARVTFQVASQVDSRTIIDTSGAEKLLGMGDMLFVSAETGKPKRIQGSYVSENEVKRVVEFLLKNYPQKRKIIESLEEKLSQNIEEEIELPVDFEDPLYEEAKKIVIESRKASASLLQRRLKVGYARAARLLDLLEERGIVGPAQGAKPREVYIKQDDEEWEKV